MKKIVSLLIAVIAIISLLPGSKALAKDFDKNETLKNIEYSVFTRGKAINIFFNNNNDYPVSLKVKVDYFDDNGNNIGSSEGENICFDKNRKCLINLRAPVDKDDKKIGYSDYKINLDVDEIKNMVSNVSDLSADVKIVDDGLAISVVNNGDVSASHTQVIVICYKHNGIICTTYQYPDMSNGNKNVLINIPFAKDDDYKILVPDYCKAYVNYSYK